MSLEPNYFAAAQQWKHAPQAGFGKLTAEEQGWVEQLIAQTAYEDGHAVPIRMEQEPGSSGKALVDQYARYVLPGYDFVGMRSTGDKVTRARPFAAALTNGNVRAVRGAWLTDWLDELSTFPEACNHDDQVDSATGAFTHLTGLGLPQRKRVAIVV